MASAKVLLIGSGGRENALAWKLAKSMMVEKVFVAPGNAGTNDGRKMENVELSVKDFDAVSAWCQQQGVTMVVVGPEDPLAGGIADHLVKKGICCFGPSAVAAQIEASKDFAKQFMTRQGIPTAQFQSFTDVEEACKHINSAEYPALVVKASGLAAGKGVVVATSREEACKAATSMLTDKSFGAAGSTVVVEELLEGEEVSVLAFTDGETVAVMPPSQDHKRLGVGDSGPNTGGMGAYCPYPRVSENEMKYIKEKIIQKAVDGMRSEGRKYVGVLYAGIMLTKDGPKVLEFNCRFGDPETQALMPLLMSDLYETCKACVEGKLKDHLPQFDTHQTTLGIVLVSGGYPGSYEKWKEITGVHDAEAHGLHVFHAGTAKKDGKLVTSGGRVLAVVAVDTDLPSASERAKTGASYIHFEGCFFRSDIGYRSLKSTASPEKESLSYKEAGVNIEAGNELVNKIKPLAKATHRAGCLSSLGYFGALFDLKATGYKDPILISGTDGVGTKLKVAHAVGKHDTVGMDLVAMCVNDILAHGAEPLFFLDYFATGRLHVNMTRDVVQGISEGCKQAGCALVGGETAEMPGMYGGEDYDIAGFAVGAVERSLMLPRLKDIHVDNTVIGIASSGLHSNGFSLVRRLVDRRELHYDMPSLLKTGNTLGEDLLMPTKIYVKSVLPLMRDGKIKAFAHITGGGLVENIPRVLPDDLEVRLVAKSWTMPPIFGWIAESGNISETEMARTFNCGLGGVLIVSKYDSEEVVERLKAAGEQAFIIGVVEKRSGVEQVKIKHLGAALTQSWKKLPGVTRKKRVAVLISGTGTNLQALIDHTMNTAIKSAAEIVLVVSNKPGVKGLERAEAVGIPTKVIDSKQYKTREEFEAVLHDALMCVGVDIICLAGFMRVLTGGFVNKWQGKMLNIHPSLLPAFRGANALQLALDAGVRITGCSVHFVAEEVDAGAIVVQESVPVYPGDTVEALAQRVHVVEHRAFPAALELLASERIELTESGTLLWK
ncbi:trifunctional purine biosynthetic protein adenosine-3-like isoform X2 [Babylonia areolata]